MGFRFRKSIKLFPGVRINLSKSGVSASVGRPGATINFSDKGTRGTVSVPGTGISYSEKISRSEATAPDGGSSSGTWLLCIIAALAGCMLIYALI